MSESYCRSCFRPISGDDRICTACERHATPRWLLVVGIAGLPLLAIGVLTLNARLCIAGAAIAGIATLIHAVNALR